MAGEKICDTDPSALVTPWGYDRDYSKHPVKIKICGLSRTEDILAVNRLNPDYIGFVFAPSRRQVSVREASEMKKLLSPKISAVGVFVNSSVDEIMKIVDSNIIDMIQLHGEQDPGMIEAFKQRTQVPVIQAVRVQNTQDIIQSQNLPCDYLLFDTYQAGMYGGSGQQFDWSLIPRQIKPFFLAGGLDLPNLEQAAATGAYSLDLSSSVETDGFKDVKKIEKILEKIRSINRCQKENLDHTADNLYQKH